MGLKASSTNRTASRLANTAASTALDLDRVGQILITSLSALRAARDELASNDLSLLALKLNHSVRQMKAAIEAVTGKPAPLHSGDRTDDTKTAAGA